MSKNAIEMTNHIRRRAIASQDAAKTFLIKVMALPMEAIGLSVSKSTIANEIRHHTIVSQDPAKVSLIKTMHEHLDVIDAKTSSLLTFNGILIAIIALYFESSDFKKAIEPFPYVHWAIIGSSLLVAISAWLCLNGLNIIGSHSHRDRDEDEYIALEAHVCVTRTRCFRAARWMTRVGSLVAFAVLLLGLRWTA